MPNTTEPKDAAGFEAPTEPRQQPNEGEGNRTAARRYNKATEEYVKSGRSEHAAKEAENALEGPEADELREAEEEGKSHAAEDDDHDVDAGP